MTEREKMIRSARVLVSDEQLIAFLTTVREAHGVREAAYVIARLDKGDRLDDFFYTGEACGYYLSAKKSSDTTLKIVLGCLDDPSADEGSEWLVSFSGNKVSSLRQEVSWSC